MASFLTAGNDIVYFNRHGDTQPAGLVSVIIASYNYEAYVAETLDSVLAQTHRDVELVVVDDCSPDSSVALIRAWMAAHHARFARVVLARATENQGLAQTRNSAIRLSCGEKIFVLDSDNILLPTALERHAETMDRTGAQAVYAQFEWFDAEKRIGPADFWDKERFRRGNYVDAMAMVARAAWEAAGGYAHFDTMGWEDYDLWLKFIELGYTGAFIPEVLCRYRVHPGSMQQTETSPKQARLTIEITARHPWLDL